VTTPPRRWKDLDVVEKAFVAGFLLVGTAILLLTATLAGLAAAWMNG
jgi:hypothetical protein